MAALDGFGPPPAPAMAEAPASPPAFALLGALRAHLLRPRTLVPAAAALVVLYALARFVLGPDLAEVWGELRTADPARVAGATATFYLVFLVRTLRWRTLVENAGYRRADGWPLPALPGLVRMMVVAAFVNSVTVAQLGDIYRGYLLKQRASVPFPATLGTILAERLLDVVVLAALLAGATLAAFGAALPPGVRDLLVGGLALALGGVFGLIALRRLGPWVEGRLPRRLRPHYARFSAGALASFRRIPLLLAYTAGAWLIEGATLYLLAAAVGAPLAPMSALVVGLVASLLSVEPITPGGLGFTEAGIVVVLQGLGVEPAVASAIAVLNRIVNYGSLTPVGLAIYALGRKW